MIFKFDHTKLVEGAEFYESVYGQLYLFMVTESANLKGDVLTWKGVPMNDPPGKELINFTITKGYEHYGPRIYLKEEVEFYNGRPFVSR
jgi:hypothetical protein